MKESEEREVNYITCAKCNYKFMFMAEEPDFRCPQCRFLNTVGEKKENSKEVPPFKGSSSVLSEAYQVINGDRQDVYGSPEDSFQIIAEFWNIYIRYKFKSLKINLKPIDVAHLMALFKEARILGQKPERDNYRDAIGYLALAADRLSNVQDD